MTPERDRDSADDAQRIKTAVWSLAPAGIGAVIGGFLAPGIGLPSAVGFLGGGVIAGAVSYLIVGQLAERAGNAAASLYTGGGQPLPDQFSLVDSLIARGHLEQAAAELRRLAEASPATSPACIRLARLMRDRLKRPEESLQWFRVALDRSDLDDGTVRLLLGEVVDLCHAMGSPRRALPVLAKVAALRSDPHIAAWIRETSSTLRREFQE